MISELYTIKTIIMIIIIGGSIAVQENQSNTDDSFPIEGNKCYKCDELNEDYRVL